MKATITANFSESGLERLRARGLEITYRPASSREGDGRLSSAEVKELVADAEVFIVGYEAVSEEVIEAAQDLRILACARGGPEANVDIAAASERGIPVLYAPGRNARSVAEFTVGLLLSVARNIAQGHHLLRTGTYTGQSEGDRADAGERADITWGGGIGSPYVELKGTELAGKTLGIVGLGDVGRRVVERARGFGMDLLVHDPYVDVERVVDGVETAQLDGVCRRADFLSIHCPLTDGTRRLIGADELALLGENSDTIKDESEGTGGYLINTARGPVVDEDALVAALREDTIAGAALDVYTAEPIPDDHPLLSLPNAVTTPHIGGATREVIDRHSTMITDDIEAVLSGGVPEYRYNDVPLPDPAELGVNE